VVVSVAVVLVAVAVVLVAVPVADVIVAVVVEVAVAVVEVSVVMLVSVAVADEVVEVAVAELEVNVPVVLVAVAVVVEVSVLVTVVIVVAKVNASFVTHLFVCTLNMHASAPPFGPTMASHSALLKSPGEQSGSTKVPPTKFGSLMHLLLKALNLHALTPPSGPSIASHTALLKSPGEQSARAVVVEVLVAVSVRVVKVVSVVAVAVEVNGLSTKVPSLTHNLGPFLYLHAPAPPFGPTMARHWALLLLPGVQSVKARSVRTGAAKPMAMLPVKACTKAIPTSHAGL
jgi:hypothetical protein